MKDIDLLVEVARMYYDQDLTQQEIADKIYVSRSRVSRLIKKAKALGLTVIRNEITYQLLADGFRVHTKLPSDS